MAMAISRELSADIIIIGGGLGGCAAALSATRLGARVILTEETDWIGGQLTSQAVPGDEHPWIERFGSNRSYRELREGIRTYYRQWYPLTAAARGEALLNPGGGDVSYLTHEPRVALAVLHAMLQPALASGRLSLLLEHRAVAAETDGDKVRSVTVSHLRSRERIVLHGPHFIDATEQGDLLELAGVEHVTGSEASHATGEPSAGQSARPHNIQAFTVCFALSHHEGENHTIDRPNDFDYWRDYVPPVTPAWPGKLLSWTMTHPITGADRTLGFAPHGTTSREHYNLWEYRKIVARHHLTTESHCASDVTLVNWPQNDYIPGPLHAVAEEDAQSNLEAGRRLSLALLYWMQTEAPRADGGTGWPGLRLRPDITGTADGLAKAPYIRESRRILAETTLAEQHLGTKARMALTGASLEDARAETFADSVGVGCYRIDLHPTCNGDNYIDLSSLPFEVPLGALLPRRVDNLLPACKNLGTTHITNGCARVHPCEWGIGEAAGALAAHALKLGVAPRAVRATAESLADFHRVLDKLGVEYRWPRLTSR